MLKSTAAAAGAVAPSDPPTKANATSAPLMMDFIGSLHDCIFRMKTREAQAIHGAAIKTLSLAGTNLSTRRAKEPTRQIDGKIRPGGC
jgi:hypothetical protein